MQPQRRAAGGPAPAKGRPWRFTAALLIAVLFHLSMITVFRIVAYLPAGRQQFLHLDIVPMLAARVNTGAGEQLKLGGSELARSIAPPVELPTINFAELQRLRLSSAASTDTAPDERIQEGQPPRDSWGVFAGSLQRLGASISGNTFPGVEVSLPAAPAPSNTHRPAEGWQAYIIWGEGAAGRELLLSPPIQALWDAPRDAVNEPLEFVITVDPEGRVANVWSPSNIAQDLLDAMQIALLKYRFSPLPAAGDGGPPRTDQMGTLFIRPEGDVLP